MPASVAIVAALALLAQGRALPSTSTLLLMVGLAALYLFAYNAQFESTVGFAVPTQPVLLAFVLTAPLHLVPSAVLCVVLLGGWIAGKRSLRSWLLEGSNAFHTLAFPVALWGTRGAEGIASPPLWQLACAVALQFVLDALAGYLMERPAHTPTSLLVQPIGWTCSFDLLMSVLGWAIVRAAGPNPYLLLALLVVPILLVRFLARDRETYLAQSLAMHDAFAEADAAARVDPMTGAVNRLGWDRAVAHAEARMAEQGSALACTVLCADLDRLKLANDHFGHEVGDRLISELAALLRDCAPADATVARLGGDEFAVLAVAPVRRGDVDLLTPVREALLAHDAGLPVRLSASLGQAKVRPGVGIAQAVLEADAAARLDKALRRMSRELVMPDHPPGAPGARGPGSANAVRVFVH